MRMCLLDLIDYERSPDATAAWDKADKWAFSEIYFRCKTETQASLTDIMTARQAWLTLENLFQSSSTANIFQLTMTFNRPGQPVLSFINEVVTLAMDLRHLGEGLSEQKIKWQILANLLPEYASLVRTKLLSLLPFRVFVTMGERTEALGVAQAGWSGSIKLIFSLGFSFGEFLGFVILSTRYCQSSGCYIF